ncbi:MAG TPA: hypothetical protein VJ732_20665 [Bryobacteraceae bacterium]|nr:hypothetical protein [Bryobacteraceae bacterium]
MATRLTLKSINEELARRGIRAVLEKGGGYYYFRTGDAADWLDRTVRVPTLSSLTLKQWIEEYRRLEKVNREIMRTGRKGRARSLRPD